VFLELTWLIVLGVDVIPLGVYIFYMKRVAEKRPWDIKIDTGYEPEVSLVIPTYEEESMIIRKLDNIEELDYPKKKRAR
jgi:cellulose synthase/poly-beta-1,6-N-acetylglucosamine synthase-like glycosyltransferase